MNIASLDLDAPVAVIGDIHGESRLLDALLRQLPANTTLVVTGDVCDRGPDTDGVLQRLIEREAVGVLGNHDLWFRDWALGRGFDAYALSPGMGGAATVRSYGVPVGTPADIAAAWEAVPRAHAAWLSERSVVLDLRVDGAAFWITHAGVPLSVPLPPGIGVEGVVPFLAEERPATLMWPKTPISMMLPLDRPVVMGHQPLAAPLDLGHVIALDTGCGRGGALSAMVLPERRFLSVGP